VVGEASRKPAGSIENYTMTGWWCNNHLEKYEFVNGKDDIPFMKWKIKAMFETTNQLSITINHQYLTIILHD